MIPITIIGGFAAVRGEFLSKAWQQRLQLLDFIPSWHWAIWVSIFLVFFTVVVLESTYFDHARHFNLRNVKHRFRETADKAESLLESGDTTEPSLHQWRTGAESLVKRYLGQPEANTLRRIIDNQLLHSSPNEVPKEGHALNAGAGWLKARAGQLTESDIMQ